MESIGHQASAAAHSLGTPLSTITVIAKELKKEIPNDSKYIEDINILTTQAKKCGEILKIFPRKSRALVRGVNIAKRHTKPTQNSTGGIIEKENTIDVSNIAFNDEKKEKPTKLGFKILDDGRKVSCWRVSEGDLDLSNQSSQSDV